MNIGPGDLERAEAAQAQRDREWPAWRRSLPWQSESAARAWLTMGAAPDRAAELQAGAMPDRWEQIDALEELQGARCGACRYQRTRLVLDHDHMTGGTRGLLCRSCNGIDGGLGSAAIEAYRANPPAAGFGWIYQDVFGDWALPEPHADLDLAGHAAYSVATYLAR